MATEDNNNVPINDEEDQKASSRDPQDTSLGDAALNDIEENEQAGDVEGWNRAYEASMPSYELNLDAGIEGEKAPKQDSDPSDPNLKQ